MRVTPRSLFPFVALVPLTCETLWSIYSQFVYGRNGIALVFVPLWLMLSITVAARLGLLLLLWRSPRDERCFILKMISKTVAVYLVTGCPLLAVWETQRSKVARYMIWFAVPLTVYTIMLGLACTLIALALLVSGIHHTECSSWCLV